MCGIAGIVLGLKDSPAVGALESECWSMTEALRHRGPDDYGVWSEAAQGVALGHRRLAILDLSGRARQPMASRSGQLIIVFNGEIYNYRELRRELEASGRRFRTTSDTEVILEAVEEWTLRGAIDKFIGMFAFAVWNRRDKKIHLVRDRLGIKPLYYGWVAGSFVFASELHAFRAHSQWHGAIDRDALALYMKYSYVPAPYSIYHGCYKLAQGSILTLDPVEILHPLSFSPFPDMPPESCSTSPRRYWKVEEVLEDGLSHPFCGSEHDAIDACEEVLTEAVKSRLIADVPLGAFLSGGVDSSTIVALMHAVSNQPVKTFTISAQDHAYDESSTSRRLAQLVGSQHIAEVVTRDDILDLVPGLMNVYDEPFGDSSQLPTLLVARLARRHVTVALSGDGGDETFAGYNRYLVGLPLLASARWLPKSFRHHIAAALNEGRWDVYDRIFRALKPICPAMIRDRWLGNTLPRIADLLTSGSVPELHDKLTSTWPLPYDLVRGSKNVPTLTAELTRQFPRVPLRTMICRDMLGYLCDDILTKVDRASMAVGLEVRMPFLDHRVVAFSARLPPNLLVRRGLGKLPVRRILGRHVPEYKLPRSKRGFSVPIASWLRGPLREWAWDLLRPDLIRHRGI